MWKSFKLLNKRLITGCLILLAAGFSFADELDDKMLQLRQIEKQIDIIQQKARKADQQKKQTQNELNTSQKTKVMIDKNLSQLRIKESVVEDSLQAVSRRVDSNESRIDNLKQLFNNEFLRLYYIDKQNKYVSKDIQDNYLLSVLIGLTSNEVSDLSAYHRELLMDQENRRNEYNKIRSNRSTEAKKSDQYKKKIQTLFKQATKLEKEKQGYAAQVSKLKKDASELEALVSKLTAQTDRSQNTYRFSGNKISWPVRGTIIREFGEESRGNNTSIINNGIDIAVSEGTSVRAVDSGEVVFSDRYGGQGKLVIIDHKNGFFSVYAYNSELLVSRGGTVSKGQVIAKSGQTGSAIQPSLHFELRKDGRAVNPISYLE
jgi:septal ring factor EnvC (AmiA/AmiB activator)